MSSVTPLQNDAQVTAFVKEHPFAVVDFWGHHCPPCEALKPVLANMAVLMPGVKFGKACVTDVPRSKRQYNVTRVPTLVFFVHSEPTDVQLGADVSGLLSKLATLYNEVYDTQAMGPG